jgi:hypothetical protein
MLDTEFVAGVLQGIEGTIEELMRRVDSSDLRASSPDCRMRRPRSGVHSKRPFACAPAVSRPAS